MHNKPYWRERQRQRERERNVYMKKAPIPNPNPKPKPNSTLELYDHGRGYVTYNISRFSREEMRDLKKRLVSELERVRSIMSKIESRELHSSSSRELTSYAFARSEVPPPGTTILMKKKKKKDSMMKRCWQMLTKVMKHKGAEWFNSPVDVVGLNLYDYHQIINHPMDLGTVKSKLAKNLYPSPMEFAEDIRLTFKNALIYNPEGHLVHKFARQLLRQFDTQFVPAYDKYKKQLAAAAIASKQEEEEDDKKRENAAAEAEAAYIEEPWAAQPLSMTVSAGKQPNPKPLAMSGQTPILPSCNANKANVKSSPVAEEEDDDDDVDIGYELPAVTNYPSLEIEIDKEEEEEEEEPSGYDSSDSGSSSDGINLIPLPSIGIVPQSSPIFVVVVM